MLAIWAMTFVELYMYGTDQLVTMDNPKYQNILEYTTLVFKMADVYNVNYYLNLIYTICPLWEPNLVYAKSPNNRRGGLAYP